MQFRFATLLAAVVLATAVSASSADVKAHGHIAERASHEASARKGIKNIQDDLELLQLMRKNNDKSHKIKSAIYEDLNKYMQSTSQELISIVHGAGKRDASTTKATEDLGKDLQNVVSKVHKFLSELLNNAHADKTEKALAEPLVKGLHTVVSQLSKALDGAAPQLAQLLDPLLNTLEGGLHQLGLRSEEAADEELVERKEKSVGKKGKEEARLTSLINVHLDTINLDLKKLKKLQKNGTALTADGKKIIKQILKDAGEAGKAIKHLLSKAKKEGIKIHARGANDLKAGEGEFEHLLYRAVHDLICVLHAVLKLTFDLLGNLGLDEVKELLEGLDVQALEPLFSGLKQFSKELGAGLSPLLDPVLKGVDDLLSQLGLDL